MVINKKKIPPKKKPIKKKICKECRGRFTPWSTTQIACSGKCAVAFQRKKDIAKAEKQKVIEGKLSRKQQKKDLFRIKSYAAKLDSIQKDFNTLRRMQEFKYFAENGLEPVCMSCGNPLGNDQWANGHYKSVGARKDLRFDLLNSHLQHNISCNKFKSGDIEGYNRGLDIRYGEAKANEIREYLEVRKETVKYSDDEIKAMGAAWRAEARAIKKEIGL